MLAVLVYHNQPLTFISFVKLNAKFQHVQNTAREELSTLRCHYQTLLIIATSFISLHKYSQHKKYTIEQMIK